MKKNTKKPQQSRNRLRKTAYSQMGRESGKHESRNDQIIKMTEGGELALKAEKAALKAKAKDDKKGKKITAEEAEKLFQEAQELRAQQVMPSNVSSPGQNTRSGKRARLKASRSMGKMPKRKWDPMTNKRVRTRSKMPGSHAAFLQKHGGA